MRKRIGREEGTREDIIGTRMGREGGTREDASEDSGRIRGENQGGREERPGRNVREGPVLMCEAGSNGTQREGMAVDLVAHDAS